MTTTHDLHGLRVRSVLALSAALAEPSADRPDVDIVWGDRRPVGDEVPSGPVVAELVREGRRWYTLARDTDGYTLRFHGYSDFALSADLRHVTVHLAPGRDEGVAAVLAGGTVLAVLLGLRGVSVLHASAVVVGGRVIAVIGDSGMGKSTLGALLCVAGGRLLTDDVLRVDVGDPVVAHRGATALRLRPAAEAVVSHFAAPPATSRTADGRLAAAPPTTELRRAPLAAVVVPRPSRSADVLAARRLRGTDALLALLRFPRVFGWRDDAQLRAQFTHLTALAGTVPVFDAEVPWGPPFAPDLGAELIRAVRVRDEDRSAEDG